MTPEFDKHLKSLSRLIYFVTDEEDRFLMNLSTTVNKKWLPRTWVYNFTTGLHQISDVIADWEAHKHTVNKEKLEINSVLEGIYREDLHNDQSFYVFLDPERLFKDEHVTRRILNIVHCLHNDIHTVKVLIFVGPRRSIPEKLSRYMEIVHDTGLTDEEIQTLIQETCANLNKTMGSTKVPVPDDISIFRGMTSWEITAAISQSVVTTKKDPDPAKRFRIEPHIITTYRQRAIKQTGLLQYVDTSNFTFDQLGGVQRFKDWAVSTASAWSPEGKQFGLTPPKGILNVGVWGCGKSLSVKAMGTAWGLPVVQLETGKLRSSQQGASEANVYQAIRMIEQVSPCIVWIDEAEKSLAGGKSSDHTDSGTTSRMIGILSTWLQETTAPICLALTANSLASLPIEFINRLDERFFFDLPSKKDRIEILKIHLAKNKQDPRRFDLDALAEAANMMVGREIEQAIKAAMTESFNKKFSALSFDVLHLTLERKPRLANTMVDEVKGLIEWVGYDDKADDGIRARYAAPPTRKNAPPPAALKIV
jgi:AAA+ superfamily predicted ATPase